MKVAELVFFGFAIAAGYLATRFRLLPQVTEEAVPPILMNISYPALIISSVTAIPVEDIWQSGLLVVVSTLVITIILFYLSRIVVRGVAENRRAQLRFQMGVGNVVYVSIPLLLALFGPWISFIAIMHSVVQDILIWVFYYPMTIQTTIKQSKKKSLRILLGSPCIISLLLALALKAGNLDIPDALAHSIERLGDTAAPLALLYLGFLLNKYGLWRWVNDRAAMFYTVAKTIAIPLVVTAVLLPFCEISTAVILGMLFGSPAPIMSIVWAGNFGGDVQFAINCCISSTLTYIALITAAGLILLGTGILTL